MPFTTAEIRLCAVPGRPKTFASQTRLTRVKCQTHASVAGWLEARGKPRMHSNGASTRRCEGGA